MPKTSASSPKPFPCGRPAEPGSARAARIGWEKILKAYLGRMKLKHSDQRQAIAGLVVSLPGHFSVQDVVRRMNRLDPSVGTATVYRNIKLLRDSGLLKETLVDADGNTVYEVTSADEGHHDHIVCLDCGNIFEFHEEKIESLQRRVAITMKFEEVRHRHEIHARCLYRQNSKKEKS